MDFLFNLVPFSQNYFSKVDFDLLDYEKTDGTISDETFNRLSKNLSEEKYLAIKTSKRFKLRNITNQPYVCISAFISQKNILLNISPGITRSSETTLNLGLNVFKYLRDAHSSTSGSDYSLTNLAWSQNPNFPNRLGGYSSDSQIPSVLVTCDNKNFLHLWNPFLFERNQKMTSMDSTSIDKTHGNITHLEWSGHTSQILAVGTDKGYVYLYETVGESKSKSIKLLYKYQINGNLPIVNLFWSQSSPFLYSFWESKGSGTNSSREAMSKDYHYKSNSDVNGLNSFFFLSQTKNPKFETDDYEKKYLDFFDFDKINIGQSYDLTDSSTMNKENTLSLTETETKMKRITYGGSEKLIPETKDITPIKGLIKDIYDLGHVYIKNNDGSLKTPNTEITAEHIHIPKPTIKLNILVKKPDQTFGYLFEIRPFNTTLETNQLFSIIIINHQIIIKILVRRQLIMIHQIILLLYLKIMMTHLMSLNFILMVDQEQGIIQTEIYKDLVLKR